MHGGPPDQTGTALSSSRYMPSRPCGRSVSYQTSQHAPPTGPTDRASEATIVKDLLNPITGGRGGANPPVVFLVCTKKNRLR